MTGTDSNHNRVPIESQDHPLVLFSLFVSSHTQAVVVGVEVLQQEEVVEKSFNFDSLGRQAQTLDSRWCENVGETLS